VLRTARARKAPEDVEWLLDAMTRAGSLEHGRRLAAEYSEQALKLDEGSLPMLGDDGDDRRFVREMLRYVIERTK
jgi:geranylgeranyl pyrophosphate synthase